MIGMCTYCIELDWSRAAKPGQVDARYAAALGELGQHPVEHRELGEQRVQKEQLRGALAVLVVLDPRLLELEQRRHYGSRRTRLRNMVSSFGRGKISMLKMAARRKAAA